MIALHRIALVLVVIGAVNWGLIAIAEFDLVAEIFGKEFGETTSVTRVIYGLVGLSGLLLLVTEVAGRAPTTRQDRGTRP